MKNWLTFIRKNMMKLFKVKIKAGGKNMITEI